MPLQQYRHHHQPPEQNENKQPQRISAAVFLIVVSVFVIGSLIHADKAGRRLMDISASHHKVYLRVMSSIGKLANSSSPQQQPNESDTAYQYEITTTNYGWTTSQNLNFSRRIISGEFFNATHAHPRYNASAWADLEENPDPNRTIVAFMDIDTCNDFLYPKYVSRQWWLNTETWGGRTSGGGYMDPIHNSCQYIRRASQSAALLANPHSRLVVLNCYGFRRHSLKVLCPRQDSGFHKDVLMNDQVIFAAYAEIKNGARPNVDVGLPPPAIKPVSLTDRERHAIQNCEPREYFFSFQGRSGFGREEYLKFEKEEGVNIRVMNQAEYRDDLADEKSDRHNYTDLLRNTVFGATPGGDTLYSYRFAETMSAGAIPVLKTDIWVPPFNEHVVQWEKCAVFVPVENFNKTLDILRAIPDKTVCEMQQCVLDVWDRYLSDRSGWVRGLVKAALAQSNVTVVE